MMDMEPSWVDRHCNLDLIIMTEGTKTEKFIAFTRSTII